MELPFKAPFEDREFTNSPFDKRSTQRPATNFTLNNFKHLRNFLSLHTKQSYERKHDGFLLFLYSCSKSTTFTRRCTNN